MERIERVRQEVLARMEKLRWLPPLLGRLAVGLLFLSTGWGKVNDIEKVTTFFTTLKIPAPHFHAILVGYSELLCGAALVIGLLTRLATIPLVVSMVVAILTAKLPELHGFFDLIGADEFTYLIVLVMVAVLGPGAVSVDAILVRRLGWEPKVGKTAETSTAARAGSDRRVSNTL
jgi:putative oxidoreductase